jgi:hypothetical protein
MRSQFCACCSFADHFLSRSARGFAARAVNRLPSSFAAVHADIEAAYKSILFPHVSSNFIQ